MSRTTQRQLRLLLREARLALRVRINRQVWPKLTPFIDSLAEQLEPNACAVMVTPYRDGCWMIYWVGSDCRENMKIFDAADLALSPIQFSEKHISACKPPYSGMVTNTH